MHVHFVYQIAVSLILVEDFFTVNLLAINLPSG